MTMWRYRLWKWTHPRKYQRVNRVPGCTCALGNSHREGCFCTTNVLGCRVHRDSDTGQSIAAAIKAYDERAASP